ncbi:LacI family DNA-binding transcriptional regulator [Microbacteriaceae bacterium VKM Ac-2855]|nr:LacI family DNA-binding transcriptional regulator [Microbacteriaceae bacterium VKM Ac-2855]
MRDVAELAGVSRQTVSLVMRAEAGPSDASRAKVLAAANALHYRTNASARLLRQRRTGLIGMLFSSTNTFELRVVERLLERAALEGFAVVLGPVTEQRSTEIVVTQLLEQRVEALACYNPDPASAALQSAIEQMPVVWLGERSPDPRVDVVRTDDDAGLELLVEHLVSLGHRRIAYAGGLPGAVGRDRAQTYRAAMQAAGLEIDVVEVGFGEEDGAEAARLLLARERRPTAVIGCSDHCGVGLVCTFARAGVAVPHEISVTGYDDSDVAAYSFVDLTAVRQDVDVTVDALLAAILRRLDDPDAAPREVATAASLTVRGSTGPARPL